MFPLVADEFEPAFDGPQCTIQMLDDPQLRKIAVAKMEGYSNQEIAKRLDCALRTVERRLKLIREEWKAEIE